MPIKNYTTEIDPAKSAGQIHALLAKAGVSAVHVDAQLALIQAGAADLGEVFLPYLLTSPNETVYDRFISGGGLLALPSGRPEDSDV